MTEKRSIPCSLYDIQGLQSWLDELALQGLFFESFTRRNDAANFRVDEPRPVRYRVDPVGKNKKEDQKRKEPYAQMGWQFVDALPRMYYIFSCGDPQAPELHSDPQTLAYALNSTIRKQIKFQSVGVLVTGLLTALLLFLVRKHLLEELLFMEQTRLLVQLCFYLIVLLAGVIVSICQVRKLTAARRALEQGLFPRAGRRWNRPRFLPAYLCIMVPYFLVCYFAIPDYVPEACALEEAELSHTWPTIAQLEGTGPHPLAEEPEADGYVQQNSSWFVPVQEFASIDCRVRAPESDQTAASERLCLLWLAVQYDQARSPGAARQVYQLRRDEAEEELERALTYQHEYQVTGLGTFAPLDHPGLDRLEAVRFRQAGQDAWLFAALRGNEVLVVQYAGFARMEDCLPLFLECLDKEGSL